MAFRENLRLEQIYFNNLRTLIDTLKAWRGTEEPGKLKDILDSCIEANAAIILLYKNLGEEWNELTALFNKNAKDLADLKDLLEEYHAELNDKIDEVNNYLMALIRDLETRVDAIEADILELKNRKEIIFLSYGFDEQDEPQLYYNGEILSFNDALVLFNEKFCVVKYEYEDAYCGFYLPVETIIDENDTVSGLKWNMFKIESNPDTAYDLIVDGYIIYDVNDGLIEDSHSSQIHSVEFYKRNGYYASIRLDSNADLNNIEEGPYECFSGTLNTPISNGAGLALNFRTIGSTTYLQFFVNESNGDIYIRSKFGNTWTNWRTL